MHRHEFITLLGAAEGIEMIDRRVFVASISAALAAWPEQLLAQAAKGKIGYLHPITISPSHVTFSILRKEWERLGYVDGETLLARSGERDLERLPALLRDLIGKGVGVLVVVGADAVRMATGTTKTTPIVAIDMETDPVQTGLVASFARPGGNMTGLFLDLPTLATKWIELMREVVPGLERIAFAWQPSSGRNQLDIALGAARMLGIEAVVLETEISDDFGAQFSRLAGPKRTGIIQLTFPGITTVSARYAAAAQLNGLPTMTFLSAAAKDGILMSYGPKQEDYFPRAIQLADRILRGDKVGDLPIERPTTFEFVLNLKTANALGLTLSPMLLARADQVIE
jgi:putative tryptophan/tyrosine transport system substrate-binding protein